MTIVATASSGGGLRDFGYFRNETVFTVYIEMTHSATPAPAWTMQYALLGSGVGNGSNGAVNLASTPQGQLLPPYPVDKPNPKWAPEIVSKNLGRMVVIGGVVNKEGKLQRMRVLQTPNLLLNQPTLDALQGWTFRPAEMDGTPMAVKVLLGIPLSLAPE